MFSPLGITPNRAGTDQAIGPSRVAGSAGGLTHHWQRVGETGTHNRLVELFVIWSCVVVQLGQPKINSKPGGPSPSPGQIREMTTTRSCALRRWPRPAGCRAAFGYSSGTTIKYNTFGVGHPT